jgi:hypothetical protein
MEMEDGNGRRKIVLFFKIQKQNATTIQNSITTAVQKELHIRSDANTKNHEYTFKF